MGAHHLAPNGAELGVVLEGLGLVDVGHTLAKVEGDVLLLVQALNLHQGCVVALGTEPTLVAQHYPLDVKPHRLCVCVFVGWALVNDVL